MNTMTKDQQHQEQLKAKRRANAVAKMLQGWRVVAQYESDTSSSIHTVERNGQVYRCTCQGFRIYKRGFCKHTKRAQAEGR